MLEARKERRAYWRQLMEKGTEETKWKKIKRGLCLFGLITLVLGVTWLGLRPAVGKFS